ncbi:hypothetical protein CPB86DRAFT_303630 [Serendipita vermifera]|nr:hypothetical protein CPB86DRAFT_303630 [Serendipita vermifera]
MSGSMSSKKPKRKEITKKFSISHMKQKIGFGTVKSMAPEAYGALKISLKVSVEALEKVPVPGLKAAGAGLLALLKAIDDTNANQEQMRRLGAQIDRLLEYIIKPLLSQAETGDKIPDDLKGRVENLSRNLESIFEEGQKIMSRNAFSRFLLHEDIREQISFLINRMSEALDSFLVMGIIQIDRVVNNIDSEARSIGLGMETVAKKLKHIDRKMDRNIRDGTPKTLPHAPARYKDQRENKQISTCLPNTRVDLLQMIDEWVHDRKKPPIFWLSGMAGTGKSTIAKTLSQSLDKPKPEDYLGASFFCSRDDDELSRDHLIIPNIAYQLAQYDEGIYSGVTKSLQADPDLADLDIENQFQKLVLEPLQNTLTRRTLIVIVMDALDECSGKPEEIVALFASPQLATLPFSVKLFVTGRPEARIRQALAQSHVKSQLQPLQLHEIEHSIVRSDIGLYLNHHFKLVAEVRSHLSRNWPSEADVQALGDLAGDLFIFAATAMKFINNPEEDPKDKLNLILTNVHSSGQIDPLYHQVLGSAFPPNQSDDIKSFQKVMGSVLCLREPLTIQGLQMLLGISSSSVRKVLTRLYSVVITPDTDDEYIRLIHPSFPDYLADAWRCSERKYLIKKSINHANLARCALKCMIKELKRNICKLEDPLIPNEEIGDLSYHLSSYISSQLRYSCFHWASHLHSDDQSKDLLELLHSFATTKLLAWLEVLVLYGRIDIALDSIRLVQSWLFGCSHKSSNTIELMENMERFIKQFIKAIGTCSGNIYASALPFTPDCLLSEVYNHERINSGRIVNHNMLQWRPCLSIMRGHVKEVCCVTFSPDGSKIVSGSYDQTNSNMGHNDQWNPCHPQMLLSNFFSSFLQ